MAVPAYSPSGNVSVSTNLNVSYAVQTTSLPPVQTAYVQAISANPITTTLYSSTSGSGAAQIARIYLASGTFTSGVSTSVSVLNMATAADVAGATTTSGHVREIQIFNDGNAAFTTTGFTTSDSNILIWDTTFTSAFGTGSAGVGPFETATKVDIPAGTVLRLSHPFGATGWAWTSSNSVVALGTPSANAGAISYRVIICGD